MNRTPITGNEIKKKIKIYILWIEKFFKLALSAKIIKIKTKIPPKIIPLLDSANHTEEKSIKIKKKHRKCGPPLSYLILDFFS